MKSRINRKANEQGSTTTSFFGKKRGNDFFSSESSFFNNGTVQAKSAVSSPADEFEQEAEGVADKVVQKKSHKSFDDGLIQRREFGPLEDVSTMQDGDWAHSDRLMRTPRWNQANAYNLENNRSRQYTQIEQRRDFYLWYYETMRSRGHEIRWPLAAYVVANGANEVANRDPAGSNFMRNNAIEAFVRRGNQVILDDVFPKLRQAYLRTTPLVGAEAEQWDMDTLIQEQNLIQPMYAALSPADLATFTDLAHQSGAMATIGTTLGFGSISAGPYHSGGSTPPFPSDYDITNPTHRWRYGMALAHFFTNGASDFAASRAYAEGLTVPTAPEEYTNGTMLARYDRFQNLHRLSAVIDDAVSTIDEIKAVVYTLTDEERQIATTDPWYTAQLRLRRGVSMVEAIAILNSEDITQCGPLFQVIGHIEGTGDAREEDNIIVWRRDASWTTFSGQDRVQVQAVSEPAYQLFTGVPLRWVWVSSLHCYPKRRPIPPPPPPIEREWTVYFDTQSGSIFTDSHEWENRETLNDVLTELHDYGQNATVSDIRLNIVGHASPVWRSARTAEAAALENGQLANQRAQNVRSYIMSAYQEYQGPVPLIMVNPFTSFIVPDNSTPANVVTSGGRGSEEGLAETADPQNNDQRYRRVDITIRVLFENQTGSGHP